MEAHVLVDIGIVLIVLISAILAYSRGLVREILSIAGWIIAAIVAYVFAPQAEPLVREIPYVGDFFGNNCIMSLIVSFAVVFAVVLIIVSIFTPLFAGMVQRSAVSAIDRGLGFLFGVARGILLVLVAFVLYEIILPPDSRLAWVEQSQSRAILATAVTDLNTMRPTEVPPWLTDRYEGFVSTCDDPNANGSST